MLISLQAIWVSGAQFERPEGPSDRDTVADRPIVHVSVESVFAPA
jgi:hypothetical protein